jgi:hypothetical protein
MAVHHIRWRGWYTPRDHWHTLWAVPVPETAANLCEHRPEIGERGPVERPAVLGTLSLIDAPRCSTKIAIDYSPAATSRESNVQAGRVAPCAGVSHDVALPAQLRQMTRARSTVIASPSKSPEESTRHKLANCAVIRRTAASSSGRSFCSALTSAQAAAMAVAIARTLTAPLSQITNASRWRLLTMPAPAPRPAPRPAPDTRLGLARPDLALCSPWSIPCRVALAGLATLAQRIAPCGDCD